MRKFREGRWLCRSCGRENLGHQVSCEAGCGKSRPHDVRFYLPENSPIVTDPARRLEASQGPNWNCDHCDGANPSSVNGAMVISCAHCGQARDAGDTSYSPRSYSLADTPRTAQDATPARPRRRGRETNGARRADGSVLGLLFKIAAICLILTLGAGSFILPVKTSTAEVIDLSWHRQIEIEALRTFSREGWNPPGDARILAREDRIKDRVDVVTGYETDIRTEMKSVKVGEEKYVCGHNDLGNGYFEDVECTRDITRMKPVDVSYQRPITRKEDVIAPWYRYEVDRWVTIDTKAKDGHARETPIWPTPALGKNERLGERSERYLAVFALDDGTHRQSRVSAQTYATYAIGTRMMLTQNIWGHILSTTLQPSDRPTPREQPAG